MASFFFNQFQDAILDQTVSYDLDTNTIAVMVYAAEDMTPAASWNDFASNAPTRYLATTDQNLTNKQVGVIAAGVFDDTAITTFSSVAVDGTKDIDGIIVYQDGGTDATREYICHIDGFTAVRPNGGNITITWSASGIFAVA